MLNHYNCFYFFKDNTARCQLLNCSTGSVSPSYSEIKTNETYEIERLTIFFKTDAFILDKPCGKYRSANLDVTINCEGKYLQGNGHIQKRFQIELHTDNNGLLVQGRTPVFM